jgi:lipopolysaccharide transport system permease protein
VIRVRRLWHDMVEMLTEQRSFTGLLWELTMRDLRLRYKQSVMGFGWAVFMPIVNTVVFSVVFTRVAHIDTGVPYPLYAFVGLLTWNFLASSLRFASVSLTSNVALVTKVYFPREILPFSAIIVSLVDLAVASVVVVALMVYYHVMPTWAILALPLVVAVQVVFTAAVGLLLAMGNLFYRDVKYLFEIVVTVWMFGTSVVYPIERVGGRLGQVLALNPMTPIIEAYRDVLLRGRWPDPAAFGSAALLSVLLLGFGWVVFHRAEFDFAENI